MTTAADRLAYLAGAAGAAGALLLAVGSGATAGAALVDYSQLVIATAAQHLLAEHATPALPVMSGGHGGRPYKRRLPHPREEDEALLLAVIL